MIDLNLILTLLNVAANDIVLTAESRSRAGYYRYLGWIAFLRVHAKLESL
jgi:hypothetical protein